MHASGRLLATPLAYAAAAGAIATAVLAVAAVLEFVVWQQDVARIERLRDAQGAIAASSGSPADAPAANVGAAIDPVGKRAVVELADAGRSAQRMRSAFVATSALLGLATAFTLVALSVVALRERRGRLETESAIERETQHDRRTRLPNRRFFTEWAGYAIAGSRRDGEALGLLLIGIESGSARLRADALAREIGRRLRELKRESDFLGHVDDNVFALAALHVADDAHLAGLAQRILDTLSRPPLPAAPSVRIAPCVGVAILPQDADDLPGLFAAADSALSAARRAGGNVVMFHGTTQVSRPAAAS